MKHVIENCWMILPEHRVGYGAIEIDGDAISAVTLQPQPPALTAARLVLPGLVNCHGHTAMTLVRGLGGGYRLTKKPEEYTLFEILSLVEGDLAPVGCVSGETDCPRECECKTFPMWKEFYKVITDYLNGKTLKELL